MLSPIIQKLSTHFCCVTMCSLLYHAAVQPFDTFSRFGCVTVVWKSTGDRFTEPEFPISERHAHHPLPSMVVVRCFIYGTRSQCSLNSTQAAHCFTHTLVHFSHEQAASPSHMRTPHTYITH